MNVLKKSLILATVFLGGIVALSFVAHQSTPAVTGPTLVYQTTASQQEQQVIAQRKDVHVVTSANCEKVAQMGRSLYSMKIGFVSKAKAQAVANDADANPIAAKLLLSAIDVVYGTPVDSRSDAYETVKAACSARIGTSL